MEALDHNFKTVEGQVIRTHHLGSVVFCEVRDNKDSTVEVLFKKMWFCYVEGSMPFPKNARHIRPGCEVKLRCYAEGNDMRVVSWWMLKEFRGEQFILPSAAHDSSELCKQWRLDGRCDDRSTCLRRHHFISDEETAKVERVRAVRKHLIEQHRAECAEYYEHSQDTSADKKLRARILAEFIAKTFGAENLQKDRGVMDIGGGKGALSFELIHGYNIPCTVVDPYQRRRKISRHHAQLLRRAGKMPFEHMAVPFHANTFDCELLQTFQALVGLHPDEATEEIVNAALAYNISFAVVPCCVFPSLWPNRRKRDGSPVTTVNDLVTYLAEKDERIQVGFLPFSGRNKVVYMMTKR